MDGKVKLHKIHIRGNKETNQVNVSFSPGGKKLTRDDRQTLINVSLAGNDLAMKKLLGDLPIMRAASQIERDANVYVFKDEVADNAVFKMRKQMYDTISSVYQATLSALFPDIEYIEQCRSVQQETMFEMDAEDAEEYKKEIQAITDAVRNCEEGEEPVIKDKEFVPGSPKVN